MGAARVPEPDHDPGDRSASGGLDERALRILAFEARAWQQPGRKAEAIREEFGLSAARYYRILGDLVDSPAALRHDPMLVKRLQRLRDARVAARARRTLPPGRRID